MTEICYPYRKFIVPQKRERYVFGPAEEAIRYGKISQESMDFQLWSLNASNPHSLGNHTVYWALEKQVPQKISFSRLESLEQWRKLTKDTEMLLSLEKLAEIETKQGASFYFNIGYCQSDPKLVTKGFLNRKSLQSEPWMHFHSAKNTNPSFLPKLTTEEMGFLAQASNAAGEIAILYYYRQLNKLSQLLGGRETPMHENKLFHHRSWTFSQLQTAVIFAINIIEQTGGQSWENTMGDLNKVTRLINIKMLEEVLEPSLFNFLTGHLRQLQTPGILVVRNCDKWQVFPYSSGNCAGEMFYGYCLIRNGV